jgi:hypothetical protein
MQLTGVEAFLFHPPWAMWQSRPRLRDHRGVSHLPQVASLPALPVPPTVPQSAGVVSFWGAWGKMKGSKFIDLLKGKQVA